MDNNNNKQFYWKVKDFLQKKPDVAPPQKPNSLLGAVNKVMNSSANIRTPNIYEAKDGIVSSSRQAKQAASNVLNTFNNAMEKQKASCKGYSNNITSNMFNLFKR